MSIGHLLFEIVTEVYKFLKRCLGPTQQRRSWSVAKIMAHISLKQLVLITGEMLIHNSHRRIQMIMNKRSNRRTPDLLLFFFLMTQTSIKCHPKKKAPTVIDPEERWIQLFPIHLRKEEFFFNKWLICSSSHHEMLHQLLARQKSPPKTIHLQSKIQADQSWILLLNGFVKICSKSSIIWKNKYRISWRAVRLPPPHILHRGWIYCKNQWKRSTEECQWRKKSRFFFNTRVESPIGVKQHTMAAGSSPLRSTLNTNVITGLDMCKVCTEAVHCVALWTQTLSQVWTCVKYVLKQSSAWHFEHKRYHRFGHV